MHRLPSLVRFRGQLALRDSFPNNRVRWPPCGSLSWTQPVEHQAHPENALTVPPAAHHAPPRLGGENKGVVITAVGAGPEASTSHLGSDLKALRSHAFNTIRKTLQLSRIIMLTESPSIGGHGPAFSGLWPGPCPSFTNDLTQSLSVGTVESALITRTWIFPGLLSGP